MLLDVYRKADMRSYRKSVDGFIEASSLTVDEPLEPLALCVPNPEELALLKGIDKGDIVVVVLLKYLKMEGTR
ncbi:hypothetical protein Pyn_34304 [Prunus yedoensis var. nudiflora]|uniref:Uncharacterized protein n=1 Tax=Prunus yedoensis var. nudiflora TaxID=2094558 RepID=A0A314YXS9_PRUYE|nr:hypothetical protein Pyn_34304 [Prunus yedoensis var. nudiflora]